jgi:opacity protein-like surface antigen
MVLQKSDGAIGAVAPAVFASRLAVISRVSATICSVIGLCASTGLAMADGEYFTTACWKSEFTGKTYAWFDLVQLAEGAPIKTPKGASIPGYDLGKPEWIKVGGANEFTKYTRVPCPPVTEFLTAGFYVQGSVGGGSSVPNSPGIPHGSGSGLAADASVGWRFSSRDLTGWGFFGAGATYFGHDESFPAPYDDLKVKPTVVFYQSAGLGPNFPGFAPGQHFAPYLELGIAEAPIRVSAMVGSATRWNVAPMIGGGLDYRLDKNLLLHAGVRGFFFGDQSYQLGAGGTVFRVGERAAAATFGVIYQFGDAAPMK